MADGIRIDALTPTAVPGLLHEFPAMKDGLTVKLTLAQVQALMLLGLDNVALALKDLSNTVGPRGPVGAFANASSDYNSFMESGLWIVEPGATHAPEGSSYYALRVEPTNNPDYATQYARGFATDSASDGLLYKRDKNAGVWTAWYRVRENEAELDARYLLKSSNDYLLKKVTTFTSSGTWTPNASTRLAILIAQGGGGGGGGAASAGTGVSVGSGGGAGGYSLRALTAGWGATETVTVGGGGGGGPIGGAGFSGGASTVGSLVSGSGGGGGGSSSKSTSDVRGTNGGGGGNAGGSGGTELYSILIPGQPGFWGVALGVALTGLGGAGGSSPLGVGGGNVSEGSGGLAGSGKGSGGGGGCEGSSGGRVGGAGAAGVVYIHEYD